MVKIMKLAQNRLLSMVHRMRGRRGALLAVVMLPALVAIAGRPYAQGLIERLWDLSLIHI